VHGSTAKLLRVGGGATRTQPATPIRTLRMSYLKQKLSQPLVKYSVFGIASGLWVFGLVDQLYESAAMMKYLLLSLLMAAVAFI
jgi:hypothetical protein